MPFLSLARPPLFKQSCLTLPSFLGGNSPWISSVKSQIFPKVTGAAWPWYSCVMPKAWEGCRSAMENGSFIDDLPIVVWNYQRVSCETKSSCVVDLIPFLHWRFCPTLRPSQPNPLRPWWVNGSHNFRIHELHFSALLAGCNLCIPGSPNPVIASWVGGILGLWKGRFEEVHEFVQSAPNCNMLQPPLRQFLPLVLGTWPPWCSCIAV